MGLLLFYAIISIFFSFLCSILEAVLLSITPEFLRVKNQEGKAYAKVLEHLKKDIDKPLIAILTLNTIAHTVGAILVGVQAKVSYANLFGSTPRSFLGIIITEDILVGIVSTIMTVLILVVSEIIPKTIGATYWKHLGGFTAISVKILIFPLKWTGLLWLLQLTTKLIGGGSHGSILSREGFVTMTEIAHEEGVFEENKIKITYLGFNGILQEINIEQQITQNFKLSPTLELLDEVIVEDDVEKLNIRSPQMSVNKLAINTIKSIKDRMPTRRFKNLYTISLNIYLKLIMFSFIPAMFS